MMEKSEMQRQKKSCWPSVDTTIFIFGVLSVIIAGCGVIAFSTVRYWIFELPGNEDYKKWLLNPDSIHTSPSDDNQIKKRVMAVTQLMIFMLYLLFICLVSLIFSVFLCYGIKKRRPGFVKAYLVYGVVVAVLMMARIVFQFINGNVVDGLVGMVVSGIYFWILLMIKRTYEAIRAEQITIAVKHPPGACSKA